MPRKRKVSIAGEEKENEDASVARPSSISTGPMYTIMSNVQNNETFHKRYIKEMKQLYAQMDHDAFMFTFIKMLKTALEPEETNEYANTALLFCAKFVSSFDSEDTHPILIGIFQWLLSTISNNPHIRFRLCYFVNLILNELGHEAALDDAICDKIMVYMIERLRDISALVRQQAILAMQRLQVPDNPDDPVLRSYQFHLCSDPSPRVRQCVITCMGRNYHTIPYILDRLWDIDEKVRRHTYTHMASYPVRSYKVSQRLTLLEQGMNDRSESVRKVVTTVMLKQWLESYQKNLILFISALKLDSSEEDIQRFRKITKQTLKEVFKQYDNHELVMLLSLNETEESELHRCVPLSKLTIEVLLYWQCLTDYMQATMAEELDLVVPELSVFCAYVESFCQMQHSEMDKFEQMEFQYMLLSLMEILYTFDLGDEIGRGNLRKLLAHLLKYCRLDPNVIEVIVRCTENLITDQNARLGYFLEIIHEICDLNVKQNDLLHDRNLITELLANSSDADLNLKLSSLKVKILDLEEQEMNFVHKKDYVRAQEITEEKSTATEEYTNLLQPLLAKHATAELVERPKVLNPHDILKGLQLTFHMVVSEKVQSLNPSVVKLYNDFICRHLVSNQIEVRDWAIKCGTAYSMLYDTLAKDVFEVLYSQFYKSHNIRIWETSINCIFELLDRYGVDNFSIEEQPNKAKKGGRQLYNTLEFLDAADDETSLSASGGQGVGVIYMMSHFLDTCEDGCIVRAIIDGFCRLVLRGSLQSSEIIEKLLLRYFNPSTDTSINQILGVFLEQLIQLRKHSILQPCLLPTLSSVLSATYDSPLHDIRPDTITRFFIDLTRPDSNNNNQENTHNKIALSFLHEMSNNVSNKDLCKILSKELLTLELDVQDELKDEMKSLADKLIKSEFETGIIRNIVNFKNMLDGVFNPPPARSTNENGSDEECDNETVAATIDGEDFGSDVVPSTSQTAASKENAESEETNTAPSQASENAANTPAAAAANTVLSETTEAETTNTPAEVESLPEPAPPPTPTTYGHENLTGLRFLRRSLNKSLSQSDAETVSSDSTNHKRNDLQQLKQQQQDEQAKWSKAIAARNLRKHQAATNISSSENPTRSKKLRGNIRKAATAPAVTDEDDDNGKNDEHNTSDVIPPSPSAMTPARPMTTGRLRLRSTRSQALADAAAIIAGSQTPKKNAGNNNNMTRTPAIDTPVRNGRKRILRKSPKSKPTTSYESSSPPTISPLRKHQRPNNETPSRQQQQQQQQQPPKNTTTATNRTSKTTTETTVTRPRATTNNATAAAATTTTTTSSTTTSPNGSISSVKENEAPKAPAIQSISGSESSTSTTTTTTSKSKSTTGASKATPKSKVKSQATINERNCRSAQITTRNTARQDRMNSMTMTRKRLSLELNLGSKEKPTTPKRALRDKGTTRTHGKSTTTTSDSSTDINSNSDTSIDQGNRNRNQQSKIARTPAKKTTTTTTTSTSKTTTTASASTTKKTIVANKTKNGNSSSSSGGNSNTDDISTTTTTRLPAARTRRQI